MLQTSIYYHKKIQGIQIMMAYKVQMMLLCSFEGNLFMRLDY